MIEEIIEYIDKKNDWLKSKGLCTLQKENEDLFLPIKGNERIQNLDKYQEFSYWRLVGEVEMELVQNYYSTRKFYKYTYPCKLLVCQKGNSMTDNKAHEIISGLDNLKKEDRSNLKLSSILFDFKNYDIIQDNITKNEFGPAFKRLDSFVFLAINLNVVIVNDSLCVNFC